MNRLLRRILLAAGLALPALAVAADAAGPDKVVYHFSAGLDQASAGLEYIRNHLEVYPKARRVTRPVLPPRTGSTATELLDGPFNHGLNSTRSLTRSPLPPTNTRGSAWSAAGSFRASTARWYTPS